MRTTNKYGYWGRNRGSTQWCWHVLYRKSKKEVRQYCIENNYEILDGKITKYGE